IATVQDRSQGGVAGYGYVSQIIRAVCVEPVIEGAGGIAVGLESVRLPAIESVCGWGVPISLHLAVLGEFRPISRECRSSGILRIDSKFGRTSSTSCS